MTISHILVTCLIGYSLGCIQTAYIIGRIVRKIDIRAHGSSNSGASNVTTVMGWKYGVFTAIVDILKATLAVFIVRQIYPDSASLIFIAGVAAILGHIFPIYLRFKGGKGAASLIGMALALDLKLALLFVIAIVIITILFDYIALGTIAMYTILPVYTIILNYTAVCIALSLILATIGYYKHSTNIIKIIKHEEVGLRKVVNKSKKI